MEYAELPLRLGFYRWGVFFLCFWGLVFAKLVYSSVDRIAFL